MRFAVFMLVAFSVTILSAGMTTARETDLKLPVQHALETSVAKKKLLDIPFFMAGQKHDNVVKDLGVFKSSKTSSGFSKSDQEGCDQAFLSAIISLQERVKKEGGDAVVDIKSVTKGNNMESATEFGCLAGALVVRVALEGRIVKLK
ncbi:MAG: excinuclease ABC subunit A [Nitrospinae bacterium]|nr:excinuclease ABC subunit A [Nitrospinota bacterium]MBF0634297.1 excinuclease ABC subunit A [Nitrospinota bacterium]